MPTVAKFTPNPAALHKLLKSADGEVGRYILKKGVEVQREAVAQIQKQTKRRSGELEDNVILRVIETPAGLSVEVVAEAPYSLFVHEGQAPHVIDASKAPKLVFFWEKTGKVESFTRVHHPGAKPRPFLVTALKLVIRH